MTNTTITAPGQTANSPATTVDMHLTSVFPLIPGSKEPAIPAWQFTVSGQYQVAGNYGIALPAEILVLDADPRNYPEGRDVLGEIFEKWPAILPTRVVRTPSGGVHVYTTKDPSIELRKHQSAYPGVDFLSKGHYVVGPGSQTIKGLYKLEIDQAITPIAQSFIDSLERAATASVNGSKVSLDNLSPFTEMMKIADPPVKGSRGITSYKLACKGFDLALPLDSVYTVLRDWWNPRGLPPQTDSELFTQCERAYKYAKNAYGCETAAAKFTPDMAAPPVMIKPAIEPPASRQKELIVGGPLYSRTDAGNALLFYTNFKNEIRWNKESKTWRVWDGKRWKVDNVEQPMKLANQLAVAMVDCSVNDVDARRFAAATCQRPKLEAMLALAKSHLAITLDEFDRDAYLLNCKNGTVDLRTGELKGHNPEDFITKVVDVDYYPDANAPRFEQFMAEITVSRTSLANFLKRALGYSITGDVSEHKLFIALGGGSNGKSTFFGAIEELLGDYSQTAESNLLTSKSPEMTSATPAIARLKGARFVLIQELEEGAKLNLSRTKRLTGGDKQSGRFLYGDTFEFWPTHQLWMATNSAPVVETQRDAEWRRLCLIPFDAKFDEQAKDIHLSEKLRAEFSGILAWLVQGCLEWQRNGLQIPEEVGEATQNYKGNEDTLARFISEECFLGPDAEVQASHIKEAYKNWCRRNGETELGNKTFPARLEERQGVSSVKRNQGQFWRGIGLRNKTELPEDPRAIFEGLI